MSAVAVRERPILFSGPMVKAILDGRKTQTRRIVKPQPSIIVNGSPVWYCTKSDFYLDASQYARSRCPFGRVGDRLWVRESWLQFAPEPCGHEEIPKNSCIDYRADFGDTDPYVTGCVDEYGDVIPPAKWRPSIHMPRWASRITLEIASVRVERLQDISAKDILAEGVVERSHECQHLGKCPISAFDQACYPDLLSLWAAGWEKINGKGSWGRNDWVWAIEFKRLP